MILVHKDGDIYCLEHHGIKGQKWGVRRYQNADGSLTEEGKKHYGYGSEFGGGSGPSSRDIKRFRKKANSRSTYVSAYNGATKEFNNNINKVNDKYPEGLNHPDVKMRQQYVDEVSNLWKNAYTKQLNREFAQEKVIFGEDTINEYIKNAPFMNNYDIDVNDLVFGGGKGLDYESAREQVYAKAEAVKNNPDSTQRKGLNNKQKKAIAITGAVIGVLASVSIASTAIAKNYEKNKARTDEALSSVWKDSVSRVNADYVDADYIEVDYTFVNGRR